jgi:hypothetical protein
MCWGNGRAATHPNPQAGRLSPSLTRSGGAIQRLKIAATLAKSPAVYIRRGEKCMTLPVHPKTLDEMGP